MEYYFLSQGIGTENALKYYKHYFNSNYSGIINTSPFGIENETANDAALRNFDLGSRKTVESLMNSNNSPFNSYPNSPKPETRKGNRDRTISSNNATLNSTTDNNNFVFNMNTKINNTIEECIRLPEPASIITIDSLLNNQNKANNKYVNKKEHNFITININIDDYCPYLTPINSNYDNTTNSYKNINNNYIPMVRLTLLNGYTGI
jgi:hypothetical protein